MLTQSCRSMFDNDVTANLCARIFFGVNAGFLLVFFG